MLRQAGSVGTLVAIGQTHSKDGEQTTGKDSSEGRRGFDGMHGVTGCVCVLCKFSTGVGQTASRGARTVTLCNVASV